MRYFGLDRSWGDVLPRYAFLEPLLANKRVLELGCGDGTGSLFVKNRGALEVVGLEVEGPDLAAARSRPAREGVRFEVLPPRGLPLPTASADVIIAFDLAADLERPPMAEIKRVLKSDGTLVTALARQGYRPLSGPSARSSLPLEHLIAFLQGHFSTVAVVGQTPFLGFSIGWLGAEAQDLPLEMDDVLLPGGTEEVAYYLVLCGAQSVNFSSQSLVQLPYRALAEEVLTRVSMPDERPGPSPGSAGELERRLQDVSRVAEERARSLRRVEEKLAEVSGRMTQMEGRLVAGERQSEVLRQQLVQREHLIERLRAEIQERPTEEQPVPLEQLAELLGDKVVPEELSRQIRQAVENRRLQTEQVERLRNEARGQEDRIAQLQQQLEAVQRGVARNAAHAEEMRALAQRREQEVTEKRSWLEALEAEADASRQRAAGLEEESAALRQQVQDLRMRLAKRERELEEARGGEHGNRLTADELRQATARLSAELERLRQESRDRESEKLQMVAMAQERQLRLDESASRIEMVQTALDAERARAQEAEAGETARRAERDALRAELEGLRQRVRVLEQEQVSSREADQDSRTQAERFRAERDALSAELADRQEELLQLQRRLTEESAHGAEIARRASEREALSRELESDLVALFNRIENGEIREHDRVQWIRELERRLAHQQSELEDSREKVSELTRELYESRRHEEDLAAALELMRAALEDLGRTNDSLRGELSRQRQDQGAAQQAIEGKWRRADEERVLAVRDAEESAERARQAEHQTEALRGEVGQLRKETLRLHDRLAEALDRLADASAARVRLVDVEREMAWSREEITRLGGEGETLREELERSERELERTQQELGDLHQEERRRATEREGETRVVRAQRDDLQRQHDRLREELQARETELEGMHRRLHEHNQELEEARAEVTRLQEAVQALPGLEADRQVLEERLHALSDEVRDARTHGRELATISLEHEEAAQDLRRQLDQRAQDLAALRQRLEEEQAHGHQVSEELDRLRMTAAQAGALQETARHASERECVLQARADTLEQQLKRLEEKHLNEISTFGAEVRRRDEQLAALTARLAALPKEPGEQPGAALIPREELDKLRAQAQAALENMHRKVTEREAQVRTLSMQLAERGERLNSLQAELARLRQ